MVREKDTMIANELLREVAPLRLSLTMQKLVVATLLISGFAVVWLAQTADLPFFNQLVPWLYTLVSLVFVALTAAGGTLRLMRGVLLASLLSDALFSLLLLRFASEQSSTVLLFYALIAAKSAILCQVIPAVLLVPCLLGAAFLVARFDVAAQLNLNGYVADVVFLLGSLLSGSALVYLTQRQSQIIAGLNRKIVDDRAVLNGRLREMEEAATDLRTRVRELQSLEEGLRAISSSLSLSDVLHLITSGTSELLGTSRIDNAALTLVDGEQQVHHLLASTQLQLPTNWPEPLVSTIVRTRQPYLTLNLAQQSAWGELARRGVAAVLGVPILASNGTVRGALTVVSRSAQGFSPSDVRHLSALAAQASIAIRNAELHDKLLRQQALLEAVIRDISDGLIVLDEHNEVVVANPTARAWIVADSFSEVPLVERLTVMADRLRADNQNALNVELKLHDEMGVERVCQTFATVLDTPPEVKGFVAILLHDITDHRQEMQERTEFVSMVSHELRNPLHSLNGFLKIVLQGRAGALNETQQEFLDLAALQVEQLKGRIGELLEFNRLEAGRLSLRPAYADLAAVIYVTIQRLQIQAEQAGITLINELNEPLPEVLIDGERIGQVLTNLIENAIKATSSGGTIRVAARSSAESVEIAVSDTGVGIPKAEQAKIFGRFYQLRNKGVVQAGHLGLGLTICQQIVEGHQGRIWVESEEGQGSTFIFSLPLSERTVGDVVVA
jgi:two-component system, NtrC family, sensor histidine kinase KinB